MGAEQHPDRGAVLVEYGVILVAVMLLSFALVTYFGGAVLELFEGIIAVF